MAENFYDHLFLNLLLPSSHAIKLTGYYICGVFKRDFNRHLHNQFSALSTDLCTQWKTFPTHISLLPAVGFHSDYRILLTLTAVWVVDAISCVCDQLCKTLNVNNLLYLVSVQVWKQALFSNTFHTLYYCLSLCGQHVFVNLNNSELFFDQKRKQLFPFLL